MGHPLKVILPALSGHDTGIVFVAAAVYTTG